jgi:predicted dehydrogenase
MTLLSRRSFLAHSVAFTAAAPMLDRLTWAAVPGANDRIRVAVMGVRGRGRAHVAALLAQPNVEITHVCDVDKDVFGPVVTQIEKATGKAPIVVQDVRKVLEDKSVNALTIAAPNHWHTLAAIWACQAGKDVFVEKPISQTVVEGRRLVEAARKHGRMVQHGTQNRSNESVRAAIDFMRSGKLGKVKLARAVNYKKRAGIGKHAGAVAVPASVDYDLWLGPAPKKPLQRLRLHYDWHWFWDYGSGDMGNQGVHQIDLALWGLGKNALPLSVESVGGRFAYDDDGETANTQAALFDYGDCRLICEMRNLPSTPLQGVLTGNVWYGTEGYIVRDLGSGNSCRAYLGDAKEPMPLGPTKVDFDQLDRAHFANFLAAMRSRKAEDLRAEAEVGHHSSALCHLANISYRLGKETPFDANTNAFGDKDAAESFQTFERHLRDNKLKLESTNYRLGRKLNVDARTESLVDDKEANALLTRTYREPFVVPEKS